jgi:hypothetical protein
VARPRILPPPETVTASDLFPDWEADVDRRIAASEGRIKFWVLGGVLTNLFVAVCAAIPLIFYTGQISRDIAASLQTQQSQTVELAARAKWMQDRMIWEARVEAALKLGDADRLRNQADERVSH